MSINKHFITKDGSSSFESKRFNATYASVHGAISESMHVFILNGLDAYFNVLQEIKIFEFGFGTGLNCWLSLDYMMKKNLKITYDTIELYPLEEEEWNLLNYPRQYIFNNGIELFKKIHRSEWNKKVEISTSFYLSKFNQNWFDYNSLDEQYDIIYFDAFAPETQVELWEINSLSKAYNMLKANGILVTYCAKGQFKRNLKSIGFAVESLAGPVGKREMTRARK